MAHGHARAGVEIKGMRLHDEGGGGEIVRACERQILTPTFRFSGYGFGCRFHNGRVGGNFF